MPRVPSPVPGAGWRTGPAATRWWVGGLIGVAGVVVVTLALLPLRDEANSTSPALGLVLPVVVAALAGGRRGALLTAAAAVGALNLGFIRPFGTFKVTLLDDFVALVTFGAVAGVIGTLVARESDRRRGAEQRALELEALHQQLSSVQAERERLGEEAARAAVLEQVDVQRAALLRSVSHDLRTPLATIRAVTSDLRAGPHYDDVTRDELLDLVLDEAERLDRLVANLLDLSRIHAGALLPSRQAVAMDELVADRVVKLRRLFRQVRVQVDLPADLPLADADYSQVDQVVSNLLENASRHAPPGSTVVVGGAGRPDGSLEVWVEDEGPGLPPFEQERIFEAFRTGSGSGSTGVGLAICRAIVEAHGGRIQVERAVGGGARFSFTLPVHRG